jgi:hypothetical protein
LSENSRARKIEEKKTILNEDDFLPREKWLVKFINSRSRVTQQESFVRQFRALGFYEAYDMVMTYAEKSNLDILWFKEKRRCVDYENGDFIELESYCTYCNKKFDNLDPLPCTKGNCSAEFCSKDCALNHHFMRHLGPN